MTATKDGTVYTGLGTDYTNGIVEQVALLGTRSLTITHLSGVGNAVGFGAARGPADELIAVRHDGIVELLDIAAGGSTRQLVMPSGASGTEVIP